MQKYICIQYVGIYINLLNIMQAVKFKISDFITLPKVF